MLEDIDLIFGVWFYHDKFQSKSIMFRSDDFDAELWSFDFEQIPPPECRIANKSEAQLKLLKLIIFRTFFVMLEDIDLKIAI